MSFLRAAGNSKPAARFTAPPAMEPASTKPPEQPVGCMLETSHYEPYYACQFARPIADADLARMREFDADDGTKDVDTMRYFRGTRTR